MLYEYVCVNVSHMVTKPGQTERKIFIKKNIFSLKNLILNKFEKIYILKPKLNIRQPLISQQL